MKFKNLFQLSLTTAALASAHAQAAPARIIPFESDANGFNTRSFFYDNGEEVVAFDAQFTPETARKSIAYLRTKTSNPITTVVITHSNPDKFNGMSEFQKLGAKVVASRATVQSLEGVHQYKKYYFVQIAKMFTEATYPALGKVDAVFDRSLDLTLRNGERIRLRELSRPGVSGNQTVAFIPKMGAVMVGDLVHHGVHAWLEGGITGGKAVPTIAGWISDLKELQALLKSTPRATVYGGRGAAGPANVVIPEQIHYLVRADQLVTAYIKNLGPRKSELLGDQAGAHYAELQKIFERAFPNYGLGYMIGYGVYGLANSKL